MTKTIKLANRKARNRMVRKRVSSIEIDPARKAEDGRYSVRMRCSNCSHECDAWWPRGVMANHVVDCPNCGCETLGRRYDCEPF